MKCIYILYKTVRIETGEYYIGIHGIDTDTYPDFNDPYLGSGNRIKASVKKHGKKAFVRSILTINESRSVVEALEAAIVNVEMIADPLCLNLAVGGRGGVKGVSQSLEHRQKRSESMKKVNARPEVIEKRERTNSKIEIKAKRKAAALEIWSRPGYKEKMSKTQKEGKSHPNAKAKRKEVDSRPETKSRRSQAQKEYCSKPGIKEKQHERMKEVMNKSEVKEKLNKTNADPEVRARRSEAMKKENARRKAAKLLASSLERFIE